MSKIIHKKCIVTKTFNRCGQVPTSHNALYSNILRVVDEEETKGSFCALAIWQLLQQKEYLLVDFTVIRFSFHSFCKIFIEQCPRRLCQISSVSASCLLEKIATSSIPKHMSCRIWNLELLFFLLVYYTQFSLEKWIGKCNHDPLWID